MSYPNWLKIIQPKNEEIHVGKVRQESIGTGEMAAGSLTAAAQKLARIIEQRDATSKILVVGDGAFSAKLSEYAIKMGLRLDCEIVALSVFDKSCRENEDVSESEKSHFMNRSDIGGSLFADQAASCGVKLFQLSRIGNREAVADQVVKEISGIRYVLSEPDDGITEEKSKVIRQSVLYTAGSK